MGQVIELDDYRPHIAVMTNHEEMTIAPVHYIIGLATGEVGISEESEPIVRGIIRQWLIENGYGE